MALKEMLTLTSVAITGIGFILLFFSIVYAKRRHSLKTFAEKLATQFGKLSLTGDSPKYITVRFHVGSRECQIELIDQHIFSSAEQPVFVKFTTYWPIDNWRLHVAPQTALCRLNLLATIDVEIDNWRFDNNYRLETNNQELACQQISDEAIGILGRMNRRTATMDRRKPKLEQVSTTQNNFIVSVSMILTDEGLKTFIHDAVDLVTQLSTPRLAKEKSTSNDNTNKQRHAQTKFDDATATDSSKPTNEAEFKIESVVHERIGAECLVCGEPIKESTIVSCKKCHTPHHQDCWEFVGQCSIYACGSKSTKR